MDIKYIFLDIDGTLTAALEAPSRLAEEAVRKSRENGHKVFVCTGRNMPIIGQDILRLGFDGIIASAGAHIEVSEKVLYDSCLPEETIQECLHVFHAHGIYCRIENREGIYIDPQMAELLQSADPEKTNSELVRMQKELEKGIPMLPYEQYPGQGAYKICFTSTTLEAVEETKKYLGDRFVYVVHPYGNSTTCYNGEIIRRGVDKGRGMEMVCEYFKAGLQDTIAFGDSMNDYEMMKCAGISVAMGNACEELKKMADRTCESVQDDGIYYEFQRMGLL